MRTRFPSRFTTEGDVVIQSQAYRDQERNREDCVLKLTEMIRAALVEMLGRPIEVQIPERAAADRQGQRAESNGFGDVLRHGGVGIGPRRLLRVD